MPLSEYPGLEAIARKMFEDARAKLPPDVSIGVLFAFHYGDKGGLGWVAGTRREDAIHMVVEWLRQQCSEGHEAVVLAAMKKHFHNEGAKP